MRYILFTILFVLHLSTYGTNVYECTSGVVDGSAEDGILVDGECGVLQDPVGTISGNIEVKGSGHLTITQNITLVTGSIVIESGSTLIINADIININGSITNDGILIITGNITAVNKLEIKGNGVITLDGGSFTSTSDGVVIESGGVVNLENASTIISSKVIENYGEINSDGTGNSIVGGISGSGYIDPNLGDCSGDCVDSATISTGTISGSPFCSGADVSVPYTLEGSYISGNVFTAQLSDASGSFASPVIIGTLTSTNDGTIFATLPGGISAGTAYRIRVVSSLPVITGTDNGSDIIVNPPLPAINTPASSNITSNSTDLGGNITSLGCTDITERGIYWSETNGFANGAGTKVSETPGPYSTGTFTIPVVSLTSNTVYYYKAFATNSAGTVYTSQGTFTTLNPDLSVNPSNLDFGYVGSGQTSSALSYDLSGLNLTGAPGNITVTAPANFEVSLSSGSGFAGSLNVPFSSSTLAATTIYVRFLPISSNTDYSGDILNSGGGASSVNVAVTGNSNLSYCDSYGETSYDDGVTLVSFNTINNSTGKSAGGYGDYTAQSTDVAIGSSYDLTVNLNTDGNYTEYAVVWIDWNQNGDFSDSGESYNLGFVTGSGDGSTSNSPLSITIPGTATSGSTRMRVSAQYNQLPTPCNTNFYGEVEDYAVNVIADPILTVSPTNLDLGYVASGETSSALSYDLSGLNLTGAPGNITVTAPANFEVSLSSGSGFASSINVPYSSSSLASTTIYVRFSPTASNTDYSGNITNSVGGATTKNVAVAGNSILNYCTPVVRSSTGSISNVTFNTINNTTGQDVYSDYTGSISTDVGLSSSHDLSVSIITNSNYRHTFAWIDWNQDGDFYDSGEEYDLGETYSSTTFTQNITVLAGASIGSTRMRVIIRYNIDPGPCDSDNFYGEVEDYTINVNSSPTLSVNPTSLAFGDLCVGTTSTNQSFTITGSNLTTDDVTVGSSTGYSYSTTSGGTYTSSLSLSQSGGSYSQEIFVKLSPVSQTTYDGDIAIGGGGATAVNVAVTGNGVNTPPVISSPSSSGITTSSANLGGDITDLGCANVTERGIYWSETNGFADGAGTKVSETPGPYSTGAYTVPFSGLTQGTIYYYKAFATNSAGTVYTSQGTFTTSVPAIDTDGDGVSDSNDDDDDNDGITDCAEKGLDATTVGASFNISGDASVVSSTEIQLTPEAGNQRGTAMYNNKIDFSTSFSFSFSAYLGNNNGADGIAIVFHNDPSGTSAIGDDGEGMGASGIQNGVVLEIDTYQNSNQGDPSGDHGCIWESDDISNRLTTPIEVGELENNSWHSVSVSWNAGSNTISYSVGGTTAGQYTGDIINSYFSGNTDVYFGFTAATGGATNVHSVRFSDFCDLPAIVDSDNDGTVDALDLDSDNDGCYDVTEAGYTDGDSDGILGSSPVTVNSSGIVTSGSDGYSSILDIDSNSVFDFQEAGPNIAITQQPSDVTECAGDGTSFTVAGDYTDTYQWQVNDGGGWTDIPEDGGDVYTNQTTAELTISDVTGLGSYQYRCVLSRNVCFETNSNSAILTVSEIQVSETITNESCSGDNDGSIDIAISGGVEPYTFVWTTSDGSGLIANDEDQTGLSAGTYDVEITDDNGCVKNESYSITIGGTNPPQLDCPGATVSLAADPGNCSTTYDWETALNIDACNGYTLEWTRDDGVVLEAEKFNFTVGTTVVDVTVTDDVNSLQTTCQITVFVDENPDEAPTITAPDDISVACSDAVPVQLALSYFETNSLVDDNCGYQNSSFTVNDVTVNNPGGSQTITRTYSISDYAGNTTNDDQVITVTNDLEVNASISITPGCSGELLQITATTNGFSSPTYQWEEDTGSGFVNISGENSLILETSSHSEGDKYRLLVSEGGCTAYSSEITLTYNDLVKPIFDASLDLNTSVCIPDGQSSTTVTGIGLTNVTQVSDNCSSFENLIITYVISGATTVSSPGTGQNDASDVTFNAGTSTVVYTVKDESNNEETYSFDVVVNNEPSLGSISTDGSSGTDGSGYKPYQGTEHTYSVTDEAGFTFTWRVENGGGTNITGSLTTSGQGTADFDIIWGANSMPGNYTIYIVKSNDSNGCNIEISLGITVLNSFNPKVQDFGDACHEVTGSTIMDFKVYLDSGTRVAPQWSFDWELYLDGGFVPIQTGSETVVGLDEKTVSLTVSVGDGSEKNYHFVILNGQDSLGNSDIDTSSSSNQDLVKIFTQPTIGF